MYRTIAILVLSLLAFSEGCRPPPCHWDNPSQIENYFNQVANVMIAADRKAQSYCNQGIANVKEEHKPDEYRLLYAVGGDVNFDIKVRDRVLLVSGDCSGFVADVRVLPTYVEPQRGTFYVLEGVLTITFPYKYDPSTGGGSCVPPDGTIVTLSRKSAPGSSGAGECEDDCDVFEYKNTVFDG